MNLGMIRQLLNSHRVNDMSFTKDYSWLERLIGSNSYRQSEVRGIWFKGIEVGIEIGLSNASIEGQRMQLNASTPDGKNKEFLEKFYKLADDYQCSIQYHPEHGMIVMDMSRYKCGIDKY